MNKRIEEIYKESIRVKEDAFKQNTEKIVQVVDEILKTLNAGGKILFFGNGGSAAESQHIAAEFIGRFQKERRSLAAIALTTDTSILTALGNDYGFDIIFARQIEGLGKKGDLAFGISTSGNSKNVVEAVKKAKEMGLTTVTLTGCDGGKLKPLSDININVSSKVTARVQESHMCIYHAICELVETRY
jgi:D-sedoheptulose 7-phosphate isomerase